MSDDETRKRWHRDARICALIVRGEDALHALVPDRSVQTVGINPFAAWCGLTTDDRILSAMLLLHLRAPTTRRSMRKLVKKQVRIVVDDLASGTLAEYRERERRITIDTSVVSAPLTILAAALAHEFSHVAHRFTVKETGNEFVDIQEAYAQLLEDEITAHATEASVWQRLRTGREGHALADTLDEIVLATSEDRLLPFIISKTGYQETFFGRPLKTKGVAA